MTVAVGVVLEGAEASLREALAAALESNRELSQLVGELRGANERLRGETAQLAAALESNRELSQLVGELRGDNERLRGDNERLRGETAQQAAELERLGPVSK